MNSDRQIRLRKAAILVSTLDESLAQQMLANLPADDAEEIRLLVASIEDVGHQELEALIEDFQNPTETATEIENAIANTTGEGVELDASLLARIEAADTYDRPQHQSPTNSTWQSVREADAATLTEMLSAEQPQTIAVVLAHIEAEQAAELIVRLPADVQTEVLNRLSQLDPADENSLQVVESQLADWINARQQRQRRLNAGRELVDSILKHTRGQDQQVLYSKLERNNLPSFESTSTSSNRDTRAGYNSAQHYSDIATNRFATSNDADKPEAYTKDDENSLATLEALDDQALLRALQSADRQTVMLALSGVSEKLMKRIVKGLPRRQANQFRQQVRAIGPTRLSDMVAAQRELIRCGQLA